MAQGNTGKKRKYLGLSLVALAVFAVGAVMVGNRWFLPWVEAKIQAEAAEVGLQVEPTLTAVGLTGGVLASARLESPGLRANLDEVRIAWDFPAILGGQLTRVEIDRLEADVDLAHWLPAPSVEALPPATSQQGAVLDTLEPKPVPPPLDFGPPPPLALPERRSAPEPGSVFPQPAGEPAPLWWREMPFASLLLGPSGVNLRYGEALLPLTVGFEASEAATERALQGQLIGPGFRADMVLSAERASRAWSFTGTWQGAHPLNLARDLFPPGHPLQPQTRLEAMFPDWRVGTLTVEALAEGTDTSVKRLSTLVDHGPLRLETQAGDGLLMRAASAGLTYENGRWSQMEAVFELDEARFQGATAGAFMANLGWAAESPLRVEIPALRLSHPKGVQAKLAARGFLQEDGAAELQLAFSELQYGAFVLDPFRWFVNARDGQIRGRVSDLSSPRLPDWQWARTDWVVDNKPLWRRADGPWRAQGTSHLEYRPEVRTFAKIAWEATPREGRIVDLRAEVEGEIGERLATLGGAVGPDGGFFLEGLGDLSVADSLPYLFPWLPQLKGMRGQGRLQWSLTAQSDPLLSTRATLDAQWVEAGLDVSQYQLKARGLNGALKLLARGPFAASDGVQELTLDEIHLGDERITDVRLRFRLVHLRELQILSLEASWLGGRIAVDPFSVDPRKPQFKTTIRMVDIESKRLPLGEETMGFLIDAQLSGAVPVSYAEATGAVFFDGFLEALNPAKAVLEIRDPEVFGRFLPLPETFQLKQKALAAVEKDFRFRSIRFSLFDSEAPLEPILIEFEGGVQTPEVEMESIRVRIPHRFERELKGWESLLILLSGGTIGL